MAARATGGKQSPKSFSDTVRLSFELRRRRSTLVFDLPTFLLHMTLVHEGFYHLLIFAAS